MRTSFGIAILVALFVMASGAWAGNINVVDPGFETSPCASGNVCQPASPWVTTDASLNAGQLNNTTQYGLGYGGTEVAYANAEYYLDQVLTTDLAANTTYTLTVLVGARSGGAPVGPEIELIAGSTEIGLATGTAPTAGNWSTYTLVVNSAQLSSSLYGDPLEVFLGSSTTQTGFDNVGLNGVPNVPEPAMFALVGAGLLGLVTRRRFAK